MEKIKDLKEHIFQRKNHSRIRKGFLRKGEGKHASFD
jgi:hypothetical protein